MKTRLEIKQIFQEIKKNVPEVGYFLDNDKMSISRQNVVKFSFSNRSDIEESKLVQNKISEILKSKSIDFKTKLINNLNCYHGDIKVNFTFVNN